MSIDFLRNLHSILKIKCFIIGPCQIAEAEFWEERIEDAEENIVSVREIL